MKKYILVYVPFLIILIGLLLHINPDPYDISSLSQKLNDIESLNVKKITSINQTIADPDVEEIFFIQHTNSTKGTKSIPIQHNNIQNIQVINMPVLSIIANDKSDRVCFLDGKPYRVGDNGKNFKVLKIGGNYVVLQTPVGRITLYVKIP
jgi:hypothetical protein